MPIVTTPAPSQFAAKPYTGSGQSSAGLALNPGDYPDFRLMYHAKRWVFRDQVGEWLPYLAPLRLEPGVGCVDKDGSTGLAFAEKEQRGWHVLRNAADYVTQYDARPLPSGKVPTIYLPKWMIPEVVAGEVRIKYHPEIEYEFLRAMIAANRISQIEPEIKAYQRAKVQDEHDRDAGESTSDGKAARRAKTAAALLDAMDAAESGEPLPTKPAKAAK